MAQTITLWMPFSAGGGAVALSGSASLTFANTGAIGLARPLSGSNAVAFANTGALRLARPLSGSNAVAFSNTGALRLARPLSGSNAVSFSNTGTLRATIGLAASNTIAFANTGTLSIEGTVELSGTATLAFDNSADLTVTGAAVAPTGGGPGWNLSFVPDADRKRRKRKLADEVSLRRELEAAILGIAAAPAEMPAVAQAKAIIAPYRENNRLDVSALMEQARLARRIIDLYARIVAAQEQDEEEAVMLLLAA